MSISQSHSGPPHPQPRSRSGAFGAAIDATALADTLQPIAEKLNDSSLKKIATGLRETGDAFVQGIAQNLEPKAVERLFQKLSEASGSGRVEASAHEITTLALVLGGIRNRAAHLKERPPEERAPQPEPADTAELAMPARPTEDEISSEEQPEQETPPLDGPLAELAAATRSMQSQPTERKGTRKKRR